jgi:hypothetical protein
MKPFYVTVVILLLAGAGWFLWSNHAEPLSHEQAKERWAGLIKNGFKGEPKQVARVFKECFKKGDCVWEYESLLAAATFEKREDAGFYEWYWDLGHGGEGDACFQVVIEGYPPLITATYIVEIMR